MKKNNTEAQRHRDTQGDGVSQRRVICSLLLAMAFTSLGAQDYALTKEKVYIHSSHVFFRPGETMFFKAYVVKASDNTPTQVSNVLYTEYLSPSGTLLLKASYPIKDGYAQGSYQFTEQAPGGVYKIRVYTSWMLNENDSRIFTKEFTLQKSIAPRILMKLDFPVKGYGAGSKVRADFSMRSLDDRPIRNQLTNYTVSIGGKEFQTSSFRTDENGKAVVEFTLPADLSVTDGLLNVKVLYDGFSESISRSIPIVLNKIDLQFMPEGGSLVNKVRSVVAFKALNEHGKAADIKGMVKDNFGHIVAVFESYHFGMGKFYFIPETGKTYKAIISSPSGISQEYPLPVAASAGLVMEMNKERKKIQLQITTSTALDIKLKASSHGTIYHLEKISLKQGINKIEIDENLFPAGIAQFTVYDCDDMPLAERLLFLNEDRRLKVSIDTDKPQYGPREKVKLTVKTLDIDNRAIPSNFSLAVIDDKLWTFADDKQDHIFSWLLLGSELKGKVEEPQFYFKKDEPKAVPALDLLMMTQGYRYFDYTELVVKENQLKFLPDQENILSGRIVNKEGQPASARVLLVNAVKDGKGLEIVTGADGYFFFSGLESYSVYYVFAQSNDKKDNFTIQILQNGLGYNPSKTKTYKPGFFNPTIPVFPPNSYVKWMDKNEKSADTVTVMLTRNPIMGTEVVVTSAYGMKRTLRSASVNVQVVDLDDIRQGNLTSALAGKVSGLQVRSQSAAKLGNSGFGNIRLRGESGFSGPSPLFIVDGIPVQDFNNINNNDIEDITVLKDAAAVSLFGSTAANGAIVISTKQPKKERFRISTNKEQYYSSTMLRTQGTVYTPAKKFYAPKYVTTITEERNDFRETIYWNPVVQTDKEGMASIEFYNSDANTTFRVIAEGLGFNGTPGRSETTYAVQNILQADIKIPPYLTVGDSALLPLVLKNNSNTEQNFNVNILAPESFVIDSNVNSISIPAQSSGQLFIPLRATAAAKGNIRFTISNAAAREVISLPVEASEKGFPVRISYSGMTAAQHDFTISGMIPGSLKADLKLFTRPEGQLLDGIESMLREPYGCFEQTSSSTYPNVFILKYLRESGKSNPVIEQKALEYIDRGYKRLVGFETSQHGFEWFGKAPAHEALTAYGLLEFTDMKEFVDVDKSMLERTKNYLLGRRDGKGGFKLASSGYDRFASVPNKIANIYIVYALTQAGLGREIQKEYAAALSDALSSKDSYQLSMMALAANNMKDAAAYEQIIKDLDQLYTKGEIIAATSVVNSRGASLKVESNALYALALMRSSSPDLGRVAELVSKILGEKSYYGYGSTQATVLALKAIVELSKLTGKIEEDAIVKFTMNNQQVKDYKTVINHVNTGFNNFVVDFPDPKKKVPYNLEIAYNIFTPPTSDKAELDLSISMSAKETKVGETVRMEIDVKNKMSMLQPMVVAKIGIPAGLSAQPWQLKEIMEQNKVAYYEVFDNYLVLYWMGFAEGETKHISLDLKAEIPGNYKAKASTVYIYYMPEHKYWLDGAGVRISQ